MDINRLKKVKAKLKEAFDKIAKEENLIIDFDGTCKYCPEYFKVSIKATEVDKMETIIKKEASALGLHESIIGLEFTHPTRGMGLCKVVEFKVKNFKYPIIFETQDGKRYKISTDTIKKYIGVNVLNRNANLAKLLG